MAKRIVAGRRDILQLDLASTMSLASHASSSCFHRRTELRGG